MDSEKNSQVWQYKWHFAVIVVAVGGVVALSVFTRAFEGADSTMRQSLILMGALIFLIALLTMLSRVFRIANMLSENSTRLEETTKAIESMRDGLLQISHSTRISEAAKAIAFREDDKRSLREAVFERLKQNDFTGAYEIVDEIENHSEYRLLAAELRRQVDEYRDATQDERIDKAIEQVEQVVRWLPMGQGQSPNRVFDPGPPGFGEAQGPAAPARRAQGGAQAHPPGRLG